MSTMIGSDREPRIGWRRRAYIAAVSVVGVATSSCAFSGLQFRADDRLSIENLADRSEIELPYEVIIEFDDDLDTTGASGTAAAFGFLVDRTPPPPGKHLDTLLDGDPVCQGEDGCPDGYLERNRIVITDDTVFALDNVPIGSDQEEQRGYHELTVILVDAEGHRVGETSDFARFRVPGFER